MFILNLRSFGTRSWHVVVLRIQYKAGWNLFQNTNPFALANARPSRPRIGRDNQGGQGEEEGGEEGGDRASPLKFLPPSFTLPCFPILSPLAKERGSLVLRLVLDDREKDKSVEIVDTPFFVVEGVS